MTNDQCPNNDPMTNDQEDPRRIKGDAPAMTNGQAKQDGHQSSKRPSVSSNRARTSMPRGYDLEERTAKFAEAAITFAKKIPRTPVTEGMIRQLVDAGTSIGANYCEADDAISRRKFRKNIGTCRKESRETKFWLRSVACAVPELADEARVLWKEAKELHLIFCSIFTSVDGD